VAPNSSRHALRLARVVAVVHFGKREATYAAARFTELRTNFVVLHVWFELQQELRVFRIVLRNRNVDARKRFNRIKRFPVREDSDVCDIFVDAREDKGRAVSGCCPIVRQCAGSALIAP